MDGGRHVWRSERMRWSGTVAKPGVIRRTAGSGGGRWVELAVVGVVDGDGEVRDEVKRELWLGQIKALQQQRITEGIRLALIHLLGGRQKNDTRIMQQVREIRNLHPVQSVSLAVPGEILQTSPWNIPDRRLTTVHPSDFVSFCVAAAACRRATPRQLEGILGRKCQQAQSLQGRLISPGPCMQRQQLRTVTASDDRI